MRLLSSLLLATVETHAMDVQWLMCGPSEVICRNACGQAQWIVPGRNQGAYKSPRVQPTVVSICSRMGLGLEDAVDYCHCPWKA